MLGTNALYAGAILSLDVSTETTVTVHTGDTLAFHLLTWNFAKNATRYNVPALPSDINFAFVTAPVGVAGEFAARLESEDGSATAALGDLKFTPGFFTSSGYTGDVSTLQGYLHLSPQLSQSLFEPGSIVIALENLGPNLELGLAPYILRQNMYASLSAGRLSVGALPGWVELEEPQNQMRLSVFDASETFGAVAEVPEPGSMSLLVGGGVILCALSALLGQFSQRRGKNR
jgi:hypothetical protein